MGACHHLFETYEIQATGTVASDRYDFNLGADRGIVSEMIVAGSYLVPTRAVPRMTYAIGTSFDLNPNRSLVGTFWGTYR